MTRVLVANPNEVWSLGITTLLADNGFRVATCRDPRGGLLDALASARFDVLIVSRHLLPDQSPWAIARPLRDQHKLAIILVLEADDSLQPEDFVAFEVDGLLLATSTAPDVLACVRSVAEGRKWVEPDVRRLVGNAMRPARGWNALSGRELEVARLAALGLSNKRIARALSLSDGTVKMHMHHIFGKLRMASRMELVRAVAGGETDIPVAVTDFSSIELH